MCIKTIVCIFCFVNLQSVYIPIFLSHIYLDLQRNERFNQYDKKNVIFTQWAEFKEDSMDIFFRKISKEAINSFKRAQVMCEYM